MLRRAVRTLVRSFDYHIVSWPVRSPHAGPRQLSRQTDKMIDWYQEVIDDFRSSPRVSD
jgi:hypothetical protein